MPPPALLIVLQPLTARCADVLWRRMAAVRHALGPDVELRVIDADGHPLEGFGDTPSQRARTIQRWVAATAPPPAAG